MPRKVSPVPKGFRTVTPAIIVHDGAAALAWYAKALGATERHRALGPGGKIWHAELQVGDSVVMLTDEFPGSSAKSPRSAGASTASLWLYVPDADMWYERAVREGAKPLMPPADMFWGDRFGTVVDPFGHAWSFASRKEIVTPKQMEKRRQAELAKGPGQPAGTGTQPPRARSEESDPDRPTTSDPGY